MSTELKPAEVILIGSGPGGLAAAHRLICNNINPIIVEKDKVAGGLSKSIQIDDLTLDVGNKQFYSRIPEVINFIRDELNCPLSTYTQRIGIVYNNKIFERIVSHKGFTRGMPLSLILACLSDYVYHKIFFHNELPRNFEEQMYALRGEKFCKIFSQLFEEKVTGKLWKHIPVINKPEMQSRKSFFKNLQYYFHHVKNMESKQAVWFHPIKGTGQIITLMEQFLIDRNIKIHFNSAVTDFKLTENKIESVLVSCNNVVTNFKVKNVISSIPLSQLAKNLFFINLDKTSETRVSRSAIVVYLLIDGGLNFEHTFLKVATPGFRSARITNYNAYNTEMVPEGKSCVGVEFFIHHSDNLFFLCDNEIINIAIEECTAANLFKGNKIYKTHLIRIPFGEAGLSPKDYIYDPLMIDNYNKINTIDNLYNISRTGIDRSIHAGLMAADAIINGSRAEFIEKTNQLIPEPWVQHSN